MEEEGKETPIEKFKSFAFRISQQLSRSAAKDEIH